MNGTSQKSVNESLLQQSFDESVQLGNRDADNTGYAILRWLGDANSIVPPWWSKERDLRLRSFWKSGDHIAGAVYSVTTRIETLPFQILPKDESIRSHVKQADQVEMALQQYSDFGQGWQQCMSKFIQDYLCLAGPTKVHLGGNRLGKVKSISSIVKDKDIGPVLSVNSDGNIVERYINQWHKTPLGNRKWWWLTLDNASNHSGSNPGGIFMTEDHPVLAKDYGWIQAQHVKKGMKVATGDPNPSEEQMQVIIGGLLGDMGIGKITKRSMLRFTQGIDQEEWLDFKLQCLSGFQWTGRSTHENKDGSLFVGLNSRGSLGLNDIRERWYPKGEKRICIDDVEKYFSPRMLAVWYCDDGTRHKSFTRAGNQTSSYGSLYTNGFTSDGVDLLVRLLISNGIDCKKYEYSGRNGKLYPIIQITCAGFRALCDYIGPYIPPCMRYKLDDGSPEYNSSLWDIQGAISFYDTVRDIRQRDFTSGYRTVQTTYHIGVEETRNFIAANTVVHNTQDNGAFLEVIGAGPADGPIHGLPVGIAHLDSWRCTRTSDPEYPVIFQDVGGKRYKFHYSRVIYRSQLPSPDREMYGVGVCAVSRSIYNAQKLIDMAVYGQEKMGSRPPRQMLVGSNISAQKILEAFVLANTQMDNQGLGRFSKTVVIGRGDGDAKVDQIDLAGVPDGFDEETATTLAMFSIALSFGVDARELWPASSSGATKADAMVQHLKARGKGLGEIQKMITQEINHKVLPPHLGIFFDAQDDEEDQVQAEIQNMRADARSKNLTAGTITLRVARSHMLENGEITQEQFEDMELADGRLEDGTNVLALFQSPDGDMQTLLSLPGIADPLDVEANDAGAMTKLITERIKFLQNKLFTAPNGRLKQMAQMAIAALAMLAGLYQQDMAIVNEDNAIAEDAPIEDAPADFPVDDAPIEDVKKNVTISPDGSDKPLPDLPNEIEISDRDIDKAIESFEELFPDLGDLLDADVINKPDSTPLDYLTLAKRIVTKQSLRWIYDATTRRYRDQTTGRFLSASRIIAVRDQYEAARQQIATDLADRLVSGDIAIQRYVNDMRQGIKETYIAEYMLAKGGWHNMTPADWGRLGNMLRNQYGFLQNFANEIANGNLSQAQIAARGRMYFASATQAFERAMAASRGIQLSQYPGDGNTQCRANCKCNLKYEEKDTTWEVTWNLGVAEHCDDCLALASSWNPLIVRK